MPTYVLEEKCNGCMACLHICPNDLMMLNEKTIKAYNCEPEMCWECYSCVKICPTQAIEVRGYADFVPLGANIMPLRKKDSIIWTIKFRNGILKRFEFPIRTISKDSIILDGGWETSSDDFRSPVLFTEPGSLGISELSSLSKSKAV